MPRKKTRHNSRKRSLVFTESPINTSQNCCSPVPGAIHPITADIVPVDDDLDLSWVSPQFNPNCENTPARRRRGLRRRAACTGVSSVPSHQPLLRDDTLLKANNASRYSRQNSKSLSRGFTSLKFVGDRETEQDQLSAIENDAGRCAPDRTTNRPRSRPGKQYGGKPMNCSINESLNPDEFEVTQNKPCEDHDSMLHQHRTNRCNENDQGSGVRRLRRSCRLRKLSHVNQSSPNFQKQFKSNKLLLGSDPKPRPPGRILACDTPVADYGLKVSIRRRKDLLPPAARNKLLCL